MESTSEPTESTKTTPELWNNKTSLSCGNKNMLGQKAQKYLRLLFRISLELNHVTWSLPRFPKDLLEVFVSLLRDSFLFFFFSVLIFSGILSHEAIKLTSCALGVNKTANITINVSNLTHIKFISFYALKKLIKRQVVSASVEFWQDIFCFCFYRTFVQKHKILHLGS